MGRKQIMRILALAYACEPGEGSEPGAGWMWSRMLARFGDATVITRSNNRSPIESALPSTPESSQLSFEYVDLPSWARFWKRGQRGIRLYYLLWQLAALRKARDLHRTEAFDLVWHVTMSSYWLGSVGGLVGPPFIFGPVGGGVRSCMRIPIIGLKGLMYEIVRSLARAVVGTINPLVFSAWRRASLILVTNPDTRGRVPHRHRSRTEVFPNVLLEHSPPPVRREQYPTVALFAGRLLPWKGASLAIRAIARLQGWRLVVCGEGPDEGRLRRLSDELQVADRVDFRGWKSRRELHALMRREVSVFVFPSLHDEGGWVVAEAAAHGLPVVCVRRGGPPLIVGIGSTVALQDLDEMASAIAGGIESAHGRIGTSTWDIDSRQEKLVDVMERHGLIPSFDADA